MCSVVEKEGKTISEAVMHACEELGVSKSEVEIEVIREDSKGVLGIGSKNAIVRVEVKSEGLSEKGLLAKRTLETILGFLFPEPQRVKVSETEDRIVLGLRATENKGHIIGKGGETIRALEYMVGKISSVKSTKDGKGKRVAINIDGYKDRKKETDVAKTVAEAAGKVRQSGKPQTLEGLSPYERRQAYAEIGKLKDVKFETVQGRGKAKKIVLSPTD